MEEDTLERIEGSAISLLKCLGLSHCNLFMSDENFRFNFLYFLAWQYFRTYNMHQRIVEKIPTMSSEVLTAAVWPVLRQMISVELGMRLSAVPLRISLLHNPHNIPFLTSDQPVVNIAATEDEEPEDLELYYPLSPHLALLVAPAQNGLETTENREMSEFQTEIFNNHLIRRSHQQLYCNPEAAKVLEGLSVRKRDFGSESQS